MLKTTTKEIASKSADPSSNSDELLLALTSIIRLLARKAANECFEEAVAAGGSETAVDHDALTCGEPHSTHRSSTRDGTS